MAWPPKAKGRGMFRPRVALSLIIGQGLLALIAFGNTFGAIRLFDDISASFSTFANRDLPVQARASELSILGQGVIADARALALASQRFAKDGILFRIEGNFARMRTVLGEIGAAGVALEQLPKLDLDINEMEESVRQLGAQVDRGISDDEGVSRVLATVAVLQEDVTQTEATLVRHLAQASAAGGKAAELEAVLAWMSITRKALWLADLALASAGPADVNRARLRFAGIVSQLQAATPALPEWARPQAEALLPRVASLGEGSGSAFEARLRQLQLQSSVRAALDRSTALGSRVTADARVVADAVIVNVNTQVFSLSQLMRERSYLLYGLAALCAVVAVVSAVYLRRRIVTRLRLLQAGIGRYLESGKTVPLVPGGDELTEVSATLRHLTEVISERENALRQAKTEAEGAVEALEAAQESLVQARKVAALGHLVAGVAHELNTPVGVLLGATTKFQGEVLRVHEEVTARRLTRQGMDEFMGFTAESLELIRRNVERIAALVRNFKDLAFEPVDDPPRQHFLVDVVRRALSGIDSQITQAGHRLTVDVPADLRLETVEEALAKVITSLVENCLQHAFPPGRRGAVLVRARLAGDSHIELVVADDGCGVPAAMLPKVFDPFVTSARGSGRIGFGLHRVYTLVHGILAGELQFHSTEGEGTRVVLRLPRELTRDTMLELAAAGVDPRVMH